MDAVPLPTEAPLSMSSLPGGRDHLDRLARAIDDNPNATAAATTNPGNANGFGPGLSDSAALRASAGNRIMAQLAPGEVRRMLGQ